ncbi:hypothetical protein OAE28_00470 [bacterium]|nr:hypothetical protein [bacterium]
MFSVHIEILLWYGMFRVAEMLLISVVLMLDEELERWKSKSAPLLQQGREKNANLLRSLVLRTLSSISSKERVEKCQISKMQPKATGLKFSVPWQV